LKVRNLQYSKAKNKTEFLRFLRWKTKENTFVSNEGKTAIEERDLRISGI